MFELVVVICLIVILYMVALNRMDTLPVAAERAAFQGTLSHVKAGVKLHMVTALSGGRLDELQALEGGNPMALLLETPGNYRGEVEQVTPMLRRASWYYERSTGDLVYVVGNNNIDNVQVDFGVTVVQPGELRFRMVNVTEGGRWQALLLKPVQPFEWTRSGDVAAMAQGME